VGGRPKDGAELGGGDVVDVMHGGVAEVRLWSTARSEEQVQAALGRSALRGDEEGLEGWWRVDQGGNHAVPDARWGGLMCVCALWLGCGCVGVEAEGAAPGMAACGAPLEN
jgi:hypothetical protein